MEEILSIFTILQSLAEGPGQGRCSVPRAALLACPLEDSNPQEATAWDTTPWLLQPREG
jgi:hypothetical protein